MPKTVTYTEPQLYNYGGDTSRPWFIGFDITHLATGKVARPQFRGGINYYHDITARTKAGNELIKVWKAKLKDGWSPRNFNTITDDITGLAGITFSKALDFSLGKYKASKATIGAYTTCCSYVKKAAKSLHLADLPAIEIKRQHIKLMLEYCTSKLGWSNSSHNKNLGFLHAILGNLIEWEILEYNPSDKIKGLPVVETQKFVPLTADEKKALQEHLFVNHYPFYVYLMVIYHTGMRPKEVLALRILDIDLAAQLITILPDLEEENSKTKSIRKIPINKHLAPFLRELHLEDYLPTHYIFGSPLGPSGNRGKGSAANGSKGASRQDYFLPSPTRIKRDTATKLWKKIVWEKLKIEKYQYALKHTGGDDKILAGMDLDALKELYGHSSKYMTEKYTSKIKEIRRKQIMEHSPDFLPVKDQSAPTQ